VCVEKGVEEAGGGGGGGVATGGKQKGPVDVSLE